MKKTDCKLLMLVTIISLPLCLSFQNSLIKLAGFRCSVIDSNWIQTYRLHKIHIQRESLKHPKFLWTGQGKQTLCMVPVYAKPAFPFQVRKRQQRYSEEGKWFGGFVILYNSQKEILNCMCMQMCMCLHESSPSKTRLRPCGQAPGVTLICL